MNWLVSGGLLAILVFVLGNARLEANKRGRIYERLDEVKEDNETKYVRRDLCDVVHKQVNDTLQEIKSDVKKLLTKNGINH